MEESILSGIQINIYLSELEIIEPELWIRNRPESANKIAEVVNKIL